MKITLIGIGLMNGSLSKDIRKIYPNCFIQGFSRNDSTIETAIKPVSYTHLTLPTKCSV